MKDPIVTSTTARWWLPPTLDFATASLDHLGDAATVTSSEVSRSSSEVAVTHDRCHHHHHPTTTTTNAIPKAITLTTTPQQQLLPTTTTTTTLITTDLLHQQLQKRLRPEDIPSIPLSLRNQRQRVVQYYHQPHMGTTTTTTLCPPLCYNHQYRPVCNFVNYLGHHSHPHTLSLTAAARDDTDAIPDRFFTSLISLIDDNNNDHNDDYDGRWTGHNKDPTTTPQQFASIVTVDDHDNDMWSSSSHWKGGDWGLVVLPIVGMEIGTDDDDDVGFRPWDDPMVTIATQQQQQPVQHLDDDTAAALLDPFSLPYGHLDDTTDLFDFD